jgi:hypothetical protein
MSNLIEHASGFVKEHSTAILSGLAVVGVAGTAYLTGKASYEAALDIQREFGPDASLRNKAKFVWKKYIPAGLAGVGTVACIVVSAKVSNRKVLAATAAYSLTERAFMQYKDKVVEQLGENKERAIRDEIAKEDILRNPPQKALTTAVHTAPGTGFLCCELYTGRYFISEMEKIRKAENDLNAKLLRHDRCNMDDFYHMVGLEPTQYSSDIGWESTRLLELYFTTVLSEEGIPCLAFRYNYVRPLD